MAGVGRARGGARCGGQGQRDNGGQVIEDFVNMLALTQKDLKAVRVIKHPPWPKTERAPRTQDLRCSNQDEVVTLGPRQRLELQHAPIWGSRGGSRVPSRE